MTLERTIDLLIEYWNGVITLEELESRFPEPSRVAREGGTND